MSAETMYSPGPWRVSGQHPWNVMAGDRLVAAAQFVGMPGDVRERAEVEANARLIAAAPQLFEGLRELMELLDVQCEFGEWLEEDQVTVRKCQDALALVK